MGFAKSSGGPRFSATALPAAFSATFPAALVAAFFVAPILFSSCSPAEESAALLQGELPEAVFYNYRREDMGPNGLSFVARAERAEYFKEKGLLVVYGLSFEDIGEDGRTVVADDRYIRDSILKPKSEIAAGYPPVMPSFAGQIGEDDLLKLVAYIKSLADTTAQNSQTGRKAGNAERPAQ